MKILVSAGEASGDLYAASLVAELRRRLPGADFFGCAGPRMRAAGVRQVVDAASLSVVGLVEVVRHIPRIYMEFRKMVAAARSERPDLAILTDSPDFHLRLAPRLKALGVPVVYLVAPQVWAWRKGRIGRIRCNTDRLLCIFPFEEEFFRSRGVSADYIGHPLSRLVKPLVAKEEFFRKHGVPPDRPLVCLLPGSRRGEALRHMPALMDAVARLARQKSLSFLLAVPAAAWPDGGSDLKRWIGQLPVKIVEGEAWDTIAHSELALAASGTVTIEAALLATPMVTFYRVTRATWLLGRKLVEVPFFSMVNLVAGRAVVPELIQNEMSGDRLAAEALGLLEEPAARERMRQDLRLVAARLAGGSNPMEKAAEIVQKLLSVDQGATHGA
ncbi:MAG: lipid-A-disaccharide synthase [Bryobacteraceae bacterium]